MNPLISVIIPVYNAGTYIKRAVDSAALQDFHSFEIILVDDGSTDKSGELCDSFAEKDPKISVFHQENRGVCAARNKGLDNARGEFVTFLDADDELMPGALSLMYGQAEKSGCDVFIGQKMGIELNGSHTTFKFPEAHCVWTGTEGLERSLDDHPALYSSCGKLYRRSAVGDVRFAEGKRIHEDSFFLFECMLRKPVVVVLDECVFKVHYTPVSSSRGKYSDKYFDMLYFCEKKQEHIRSLYPEFANKIPNLKLKVNMAMLHSLSNQVSFKYLKQELECISIIRANKNSFSPAISDDEKWFKIIVLHLYFPYKVFHLAQKKMRHVMATLKK